MDDPRVLEAQQLVSLIQQAQDAPHVVSRVLRRLVDLQPSEPSDELVHELGLGAFYSSVAFVNAVENSAETILVMGHKEITPPIPEGFCDYSTLLYALDTVVLKPRNNQVVGFALRSLHNTIYAYECGSKHLEHNHFITVLTLARRVLEEKLCIFDDVKRWEFESILWHSQLKIVESLDLLELARLALKVWPNDREICERFADLIDAIVWNAYFAGDPVFRVLATEIKRGKAAGQLHYELAKGRDAIAEIITVERRYVRGLL